MFRLAQLHPSASLKTSAGYAPDFGIYRFMLLWDFPPAGKKRKREKKKSVRELREAGRADGQKVFGK
jgi:hypothetical protein